jgi:hypothetical protein
MSTERKQMVCDCRYPAICGIRYHLTDKAKAGSYYDMKEEIERLKAQRETLLAIVRTLARFLFQLTRKHRRAA